MGTAQALLLAGPVVFCIVLFLTRVVVVVAVEGASMEPTLEHGDVVLVVRCRWLLRPRGRQVVLIRDESREGPNLIKRIVGWPGDSYADRPRKTVPLGMVRVLGDAAQVQGAMPLNVSTSRIVGVSVGRVRRARGQEVAHAP